MSNDTSEKKKLSLNVQLRMKARHTKHRVNSHDARNCTKVKSLLKQVT